MTAPVDIEWVAARGRDLAQQLTLDGASDERVQAILAEAIKASGAHAGVVATWALVHMAGQTSVLLEALSEDARARFLAAVLGTRAAD